MSKKNPPPPARGNGGLARSQGLAGMHAGTAGSGMAIQLAQAVNS